MKTLTLTFSDESVKAFDEFLNFKFGEAAGYLDRDEVKREESKNKVSYHITSSPQTCYQLGYDWAIWQFPPKQ